jgi:hypothetical protein
MRGILLDLLEAFGPVVFMLALVGVLHYAERHTVVLPEAPQPECIAWRATYVPCFAVDHRLPGVVYPLGYALHCPGHPQFLVDLTKEKP